MGKANIRVKCRQVVMSYFRLAPTAASDLTNLMIPPSHLMKTTALPLCFMPGASGGLEVRRAIGAWRDFEQEVSSASPFHVN